METTDAMYRKTPWPDPTPDMLADPTFNTIWGVIKSWDINVPETYDGYMGATGNHVRAILDALRVAQPSGAPLGYQHVEIMGHQQVAGFVQPIRFGGVVLFHVTMPAGQVEQTLDRDEWIGDDRCGKGTRIQKTWKAVDVYLGAAGVFRMTPTTELGCAEWQPGERIEVIERVVVEPF